MASSVVLHGPYFYDFGPSGLAPGASYGVFRYGGGISQQSTVTVTAMPYPVAANATVSLSVGDVALTRIPAAGVLQTIYAGTYVKNIGNQPIREATVWISTVQ